MRDVSVKSKKEIKAQSAKKNYVYNVIYQVLLIIVPFVVTPYVSRVLTPEGIGQFSFSQSLITYFTLFAALGFGYYAQREIAKKRDDAYKRSCLFWEIFLCRLIPTAICLTVNFILAFAYVYGDYSVLMMIMSCNIAAVAFDTSYYFQGMENFKKIVFRNVVVKIITVVLIFVLVNSSDEVWLYALITFGMTVIGNLTLWIGLPGYLVKVKLSDLNPIRHLPGTLKLFIPTVVISIYTVLDKTFIGILTQSDAQNGYYEQADKIVKLTLTVITCLGSVMIPRNTSEWQKGNKEKVRSNIYFASKFVWFLGTAFAFGLAATTFNFNGWFFGAGYEPVNGIICVLSSLSVIIGLSNVIGIQFIIPTGKDRLFTVTVTAGAIVNVALNIPLIIFFGAFGAALATIIAEVSVTAMQLICVRKELNIKKIIFGGIKNIISGGAMFAAILPMSLNLPDNVGYTVLIMLVGAAVYFLCLLILRDRFFISNVMRVFRRFFQKHSAGDQKPPETQIVSVSLSTDNHLYDIFSDSVCDTVESCLKNKRDTGVNIKYCGRYSCKKYEGRYMAKKYISKYVRKSR